MFYIIGVAIRAMIANITITANSSISVNPFFFIFYIPPSIIDAYLIYPFHYSTTTPPVNTFWKIFKKIFYIL